MRTRAQWETEIDASATSNGLTTSTSSVAEWKLWRDLAITLAMILEGIVFLFTKETDVQINSKQHGGIYWYGQISKDFQNGDTLVVNEGVLEYSPVDATHRIITHVSVKEIYDDVLVVKVAKTVSGVLVALGSTELSNYKAYMAKRKLPGTKVNLYSNNADNVLYNVTVYYDPLFAPATVQANVLASLDLFKINFAFDSILYQSALVDAISNAEGVKGLSDLVVTVTTNGATSVLVNSTELFAGYFNFDGASTITLVSA